MSWEGWGNHAEIKKEGAQQRVPSHILSLKAPEVGEVPNNKNKRGGWIQYRIPLDEYAIWGWLSRSKKVSQTRGEVGAHSLFIW